jgi:phospholipid/cholesterol/gamma-HCH transport system ATP-binding protein
MSEARGEEVILSVRGVVNRFGRQLVHDEVSFDVRRGEIVGIVGGSGSGKSVMLRTMTGLRKPNAGEVLIGNMPVQNIKPAQTAALFGMLFQEGALFSSLTVAQNIMLPMREHTDLTAKQQALLAQMKLALVKLPADSGVKYPSELSGGMTKRAALARALALDPRILFLDEPTAGLDPVTAGSFDELVLDLNHSLGVTVVMVTHDLDTLFAVCHRVAVLVDKKVVMDTVPNLLKSEHPWIREYFHGPRARGALVAAEAMHAGETHARGPGEGRYGAE